MNLLNIILIIVVLSSALTMVVSIFTGDVVIGTLTLNTILLSMILMAVTN